MESWKLSSAVYGRISGAFEAHPAKVAVTINDSKYHQTFHGSLQLQHIAF